MSGSDSNGNTQPFCGSCMLPGAAGLTNSPLQWLLLMSPSVRCGRRDHQGPKTCLPGGRIRPGHSGRQRDRMARDKTQRPVSALSWGEPRQRSASAGPGRAPGQGPGKARPGHAASGLRHRAGAARRPFGGEGRREAFEAVGSFCSRKRCDKPCGGRRSPGDAGCRWPPRRGARPARGDTQLCTLLAQWAQPRSESSGLRGSRPPGLGGRPARDLLGDRGCVD